MIQAKSKNQAVNLPSSESSDFDSSHVFAETSPSLAHQENLVSALKTKLKSLKKVDSVWYEEVGGEFYIYFEASQTDRMTLRPLFEVQYEIEEDFPDVGFHFRVDSQELEKRKMTNHLVRLI